MDLPLGLQGEIVQRLLYLLASLFAILVIVKASERLARRYIEDPTRVYHTVKFIRRSGGLLAVVLVLVLLSPDIRVLIGVLTVIGAGLAIALREALLSMAGWVRIITLSPYRPGDRIEINEVRGDVIDVQLLRTTLMEIGGWVKADQSTGRIVHLPNSWIFQYSLYNYTRGFHFIWNELAVTVTFRSDWETARDIMLSLAEESAAIIEQQAQREIKEVSREYLIYYNILTPFVYVRIVENGIQLTLRYLCEVRKRRGTEHALTVSILAAFKERGGIELAYPMVGVSRLEPPQFGPMPGLPTDASGVKAGDAVPGSASRRKKK